jgi:hypothetical protein
MSAIVKGAPFELKPGCALDDFIARVRAELPHDEDRSARL